MYMASTKRRTTAEYFSSKRAAGILGVQKDTLLKWIRRGKIAAPASDPINGYYRWTATDLELVRKLVMDKEK